MEKVKLARTIKGLLEGAFGDRLKGVVLYGSEARGDAEEDSDIDIFVLLEGPISFWADTRKIIETIYEFQLEIDRVIHAAPVDVDDFNAGEFAVYRNARKEGISV